MFRYLESIRVNNGLVSNLEGHQRRVERTLGVRSDDTPIQLVNVLPEIPDTGLYKWRLEYNLFGLVSQSMTPYIMKPILSVMCIDIHFDYSRKFSNRSRIDLVYTQKENADDILMIKNGLVTDTSYGNVAFYRDGHWITPEQPLLQGVRRESLLATNKIQLGKISKSEIHDYNKMTIFNAMIDIGEIEIPVKDIIWE